MAITDKYIIQQAQTFLDICLESAGEIDGLFLCAIENEMGITDDLIPGQSVLGVSPDASKLSIVALFRTNPPASGTTVDQALPGGIGYMQIENNFIVS